MAVLDTFTDSIDVDDAVVVPPDDENTLTFSLRAAGFTTTLVSAHLVSTDL